MHANNLIFVSSSTSSALHTKFRAPIALDAFFTLLFASSVLSSRKFNIDPRYVNSTVKVTHSLSIIIMSFVSSVPTYIAARFLGIIFFVMTSLQLLTLCSPLHVAFWILHSFSFEVDGVNIASIFDFFPFLLTCTVSPHLAIILQIISHPMVASLRFLNIYMPLSTHVKRLIVSSHIFVISDCLCDFSTSRWFWLHIILGFQLFCMRTPSKCLLLPII